ncbi:hypothetical protein GRAN_2442 [Granulicella sibirica]|uniref:Uncharacterized protein n=1 Tax=Granulicella sibirica TaxID=2479048 RepID=A0A4Q0SWU7_9BACT|nr:hypothetical protein GRAN_2442 [Granulicella sibirica]
MGWNRCIKNCGRHGVLFDYLSVILRPSGSPRCELLPELTRESQGKRARRTRPVCGPTCGV